MRLSAHTGEIVMMCSGRPYLEGRRLSKVDKEIMLRRFGGNLGIPVNLAGTIFLTIDLPALDNYHFFRFVSADWMPGKRDKTARLEVKFQLANGNGQVLAPRDWLRIRAHLEKYMKGLIPAQLKDQAVVSVGSENNVLTGRLTLPN